MKLKSLLVLVLVAAGLVLGTSCQSKQQQPPPASVDLTPGYVSPAK